MNKKHSIEKEVEKTVNAFDEIKRVKGNPYLITRINEALQEKPITTPRFNFAMLSFALLLLLNVLTLLSYGGQLNQEQAIGLEVFASEYGLQSDNGTSYDFFIPNQ